MLSKNKNTKEISRDLKNRPYLSLRLMISLLMGCVRQLDAKDTELDVKDTAQDIIIKNLTERVEALEKCQIA